MAMRFWTWATAAEPKARHDLVLSLANKEDGIDALWPPIAVLGTPPRKKPGNKNGTRKQTIFLANPSPLRALFSPFTVPSGAVPCPDLR
jgi:hypothetical protein